MDYSSFMILAPLEECRLYAMHVPHDIDITLCPFACVILSHYIARKGDFSVLEMEDGMKR